MAEPERRSSVSRAGDRPMATAAIGAMAIAFTGIFVRLSGESPSTVAVFRCLYALPPLAVLAVLERRRFGSRPPSQRLLALLAGVFFAADLIWWHHSIEAVGAGLATVLGNLQILFVGLVAWMALGERLDVRLILSIPIAVAGVVLISGVLEEGAFGEDPALGVVFGILTALAYTAFLLILRAGNADIRRPAGPLFDASLATVVASAVAGFVVGDLDPWPGWPAQGWLLLLALSGQVVGWLLISVSLPRLPAAITSFLLLLQPVTTVALSMLILGEAPSLLQLAGVALVLVAVVVAALRRRAPSEPEPAPIATPVVEPAGESTG